MEFTSQKSSTLNLFQLIVFTSLMFSAQLAGAQSLDSLSLQLMAPWHSAETVLDNTEQATAELMGSGWVTSNTTTPNSFGVTFKTGVSEYVLKSTTLMIASAGDPAVFSGEVKVGLYEVPEGNFPPSLKPFYEATSKGIQITSQPMYTSVSLGLPRLKPNTWYGIAFSLPNAPLAKIMGYQVPNVAPKPSLGFETGRPFWGDTSGEWKPLLYPYVWIDGWDVESPAFKEMQDHAKVGFWGGLILLLAMLVVFSGLFRRFGR